MHQAQSKPIGLALFGDQGHQIHKECLQNKYPDTRLIGFAGFKPGNEAALKAAGIPAYSNLQALLALDQVDLVCFCSARRDIQGEHILEALEAGKHVYAEKPCCLSETVLDAIISTAQRKKLRFHEMNASSFSQPYNTLREIVKSGQLGEIVQIFCQKSYPWGEWRPKDERIDGGLARQVGIYNLRFAEQVAGLKITDLQIKETRLGNPNPDSDCRRAVSMLMEFENGAVGSAVANYSCPPPEDWGHWGYETVRIFGTNGFVESIDRGRIGTLAVRGEASQTLDFSGDSADYLQMFLEEIKSGQDRIPLSLEEELNPTRWLLRAKKL